MLQELDHLPSEFMTVSARELYRVLPTSTLIHLPGTNRRPVFVSVLLHGNEDAGLLALQSVLSKYAGRLLPRALSIFVGNVEAAKAGVRRLEHQPDFNRIWSKTAPSTEYERMAASVVAVMKARDVFVTLDLHNNSGKNPLYSCLSAVDGQHLRLASRFSPLAVLLQSQPSLGAAFAPICPTVSCECGEIGNALGVSRAAELIETCLSMSDESDDTADMGPLDVFEIFAVLKIPESLSLGCDGDAADVRLLPDIESLNFRALQAGRVLATTPSHLSIEPLQAFGLSGETIEGLFVQDGPNICLSTDAVAAMLTRDVRAIRQDCFGYLMKRVPDRAQ
jgi:succinylglutamate desuccinylase